MFKPVPFLVLCFAVSRLAFASDFCDFEPVQSRLNVYDFPEVDTALDTDSSKAAALLEKMFSRENTVFRSLIDQSRVGGRVRSDTIRAQIPLAFAAEKGRIKFTIRNQIRSNSYDIDDSGVRILPPRLSERSYDNTYELWQNAGYADWLGFMTTSNDTNGETSTRGVTIGKAYFLADGAFVFDSTAPHPSLYRVSGGTRVPGLSATRSTWKLDARGKLARATTSLTFPVDGRTMNLIGNKPTIERFCNLVSQAELMIKFPDVSSIRLYSDATERGGMTEASLQAESGRLRFKGILTGLVTESGSRRGFAGIRVPLVLLEGSSVLRVNAENVGESVTVRAVFKSSDAASPGGVGELTYQLPFLMDAKSSRILAIDLTKLVPVVRGVEVDPKLAPPFNPLTVTDFGIEVRVTDQKSTSSTAIPEFDLRFDLAASEAD